MATTLTKPTNPHNNTSPVLLHDRDFVDPFALVSSAGLPKEFMDQVVTHCQDLVKDSWLGFLDMFQMNKAFETDYVEVVESKTPDYVIDDVGAVSRAGDVFTIDYTAVQGYEAGEDAFFYEVDNVITVADDAGERQQGVVTAVNKAASTITAVSRDAAWTVDTANLSLDVSGDDFDRASCGPEGHLHLRKTKSKHIKLQIIKAAQQRTGGKKFAYCFPGGEVKWYDQNFLELKKKLNTKVAKTLMLETKSVEGGPAHSIGKYGTEALFQQLEENALVATGLIESIADLQSITAYWDELGLTNKNFFAHVNIDQFRAFEALAGLIAAYKGVELHVVLGNTPDNYMKIGFNSITLDGYTIHFSKWDLTTGNSPLGKNRIGATMPKGIIMPEGTVRTKIAGVDAEVPYIFKAYQNMQLKPGMIRSYKDGGFYGQGDCEYAKDSLSTTVGIVVPCSEAITIIV